jgi:tetratricopeptide (TPR) repeat protein
MVKGKSMKVCRRVTKILASALVMVLLCAHCWNASAALTTLEKEYTYYASENDSRVTSRIIALSRAQRLLYEELSNRLVARPMVKELGLTRERITALLTLIVSTDMKQEKWDGSVYSVRVRAVVDVGEVELALESLTEDHELGQEIEETGREGERITKDLEAKKANKQKQEEYTRVIHELKAIALVENGYALRNSKEYTKSVEAFNKAIEVDPRYARAYIGRSGTYRRLGQFDKAVQDADSAVVLDPTIAGAYDNRGLAYACLGRYEAAIADYSKGIAISPHEARFFFNRGLAYSMINRYVSAIKDYDKAVELKQNYAAVYFHRGVAYANSGNFEKAVENFKTASRLKYKPAQDFLISEGIQW